MTESFFERGLVTLIGSLGGFLLGLLAVLFKERRDRLARIRAMHSVLDMLVLQLKEVLHEDPRKITWLKVDALFQFLDLTDDTRAPKKGTHEFFRVFGQWTRGFYLAGGIRASEANAVKAQLQRLSDALQTRAHSP
jgi:hypothetical protein